MKRLLRILTVILILFIAKFGYTETLISPINEPEFKTVKFSNGQELKYVVSRVLVSTQNHESGMPEEVKKVEKVVCPVCVCPHEKDFAVSYEWSH